jgi:hypothetical protein
LPRSHVRDRGARIDPGSLELVPSVFLTCGDSTDRCHLRSHFIWAPDTNARWLSADAVLDAGRRSDAVVYAVSWGAEKNAAFLRDLSEGTGGTLFRVESTRNLSATFVHILEEFRHRYLVSYTPRGVPKDGWHRLDVRVKGRRALVRARPGYLAQIP